MLQGPMFQYWDFDRVAKELDRAEAALMGGSDLDYGNARADGFFNVQVIQAVLQRAGYEVLPTAGKNGLAPNEDTAKETAFILNKQEHWFALRRLGREWFDLNSCIKTPQHFNDSDIRWHISDAMKQGYSVFMIRGNFPKTALEEDHTKLIAAVQGCGRPGQGYSLFAGGGSALGGGSAAPPANDAAAMRAARLARLGGGGANAPPPQAAYTAPPAPEPAPAAPAPQGRQLAGLPPPSQAPPSEACSNLMAMGFERPAVEAALARAKGNVEEAANILLSAS